MKEGNAGETFGAKRHTAPIHVIADEDSSSLVPGIMERVIDESQGSGPSLMPNISPSQGRGKIFMKIASGIQVAPAIRKSLRILSDLLRRSL
eukprot:3093751-Pyramimonas_sp.AAC.1